MRILEEIRQVGLAASLGLSLANTADYPDYPRLHPITPQNGGRLPSDRQFPSVWRHALRAGVVTGRVRQKRAPRTVDTGRLQKFACVLLRAPNWASGASVRPT